MKLQLKNTEYVCEIDPLTKLPNRTCAIDALTAAQAPVAILLDIDDFTNINDFFGIEVGDCILQAFANLLQTFAKEREFNVFRIGSDEFLFFKDGMQDFLDFEDDLEDLVSLIRDAEYEIEGFSQAFHIDTTMGVCFEAGRVLEKCDLALKNARLLKKRFLAYSEDLTVVKQFQERLKWTKIVDNITKAYFDKSKTSPYEIVPHYQPIVNREKEIIKYESLIRICRGEEKINPAEFLEIAQAGKFFTQITLIMIDMVLKDFKDKQTLCSINFLGSNILNHDITNFIKDKIIEYKMQGRVVVEILESEDLERMFSVKKFMRDMRALGCKIAIDDFGSGYSNFHYLLELKPDYIKIDGSIIKDIAKEQNSYIIAKTIVNFAKELGIKTIAEYISDEDIYNKAMELGVDEFQGFYFSQPVSIQGVK